MKLAYEAFDKTLELLKPGTTMGELADTAVLTALGGRLQAGLGFHGRGTGDDGPLLDRGRSAQAGDPQSRRSSKAAASR